MNTITIRNAIALAALVVLVLPGLSSADEIDELRDEIDDKRDKIEELNEDIEKYQGQLQEIGEEKQTLESTVAELDLSRKKLGSDINATEVKIESAVLSIEKLNLEIERHENNIDINTDAIANTMRRIHEADSQTLVEQMLGYENFSDFWSSTDNLSQFQVALTDDLQNLYKLKQELEQKQASLREERQNLRAFQSDLKGKQEVVASAQQEKETLLAQTANEEVQYQRLLQEKLRLRDQFLQELRSIENKLRIQIDPSSIPSSGSGVLAWPLDNITITQYFGNTAFASANPQVYSGKGHNGVDFSSPRGTRVKAALAGTVIGFGNTDAVSGCYSYGKWILLRHNNGLATLYAHLDVISVSQGQLVGTGEVIGYSGNTGYSTGPHLHFTVYASEGVQIRKFENSINCKNTSIPIAPQEAYLNPLSYL